MPAQALGEQFCLKHAMHPLTVPAEHKSLAHPLQGVQSGQHEAGHLLLRDTQDCRSSLYLANMALASQEVYSRGRDSPDTQN